MVYTVTFNPAIDYVVRMEKLKTGEVNRASYEEMFFGGKGINVSIVLNELGIKSKALGFTAGFTGEAIENGLMAMGIDADFVRLEKGNSRINVKIKTNEETEINGQGPHIDENALAALFGLYALAPADGLSLIADKGIERLDLIGTALCEFHDRERTVGIIGELLARCASVKCTAAGQTVLVIEEI